MAKQYQFTFKIKIHTYVHAYIKNYRFFCSPGWETLKNIPKNACLYILQMLKNKMTIKRKTLLQYFPKLLILPLMLF